MAIFEKYSGGEEYSESPYTYTKSESGTTLRKVYVGKPATMLSLVQAFTVGALYELTSDDGVPISGSFYGKSARLTFAGVGIARAELEYSDASDEEETSDGVRLMREELGWEKVEQPITSAPFWRAYFDTQGTENERKALKAIDVYLSASSDTEGMTEASKIFSGASTNEQFLKMLKKRQVGVSAYWIPVITARKEEQRETMPSDFGEEVAKRGCTPDLDKVSVSGITKDWLGGGDSVVWESSTGLFTRTRYWLGADEWDEDLYEAKE